MGRYAHGGLNITINMPIGNYKSYIALFICHSDSNSGGLAVSTHFQQAWVFSEAFQGWRRSLAGLELATSRLLFL